MSKSDDKKTVLPYDALYETHDSTNCAEKAAKASVMGLTVGVAIAGHDVIGYTKPSTVLAGVTRAGSIIIPAAAVGAVYSTAVCLSSKITGYDDGINHFVGGCAAGAIIGARTKSMAAGTCSCVALGIIGFMAKKAFVEDVNLMYRASNIKRFPNQGLAFQKSFDPWRKEVKEH